MGRGERRDRAGHRDRIHAGRGAEGPRSAARASGCRGDETSRAESGEAGGEAGADRSDASAEVEKRRERRRRRWSAAAADGWLAARGGAHGLRLLGLRFLGLRFRPAAVRSAIGSSSALVILSEAKDLLSRSCN